MAAMVGLQLILALTHNASAEPNKLGKEFGFECREGFILKSIDSTFNKQHKDRIWNYSCTPATFDLIDCKWTGYLNQFGKDVDWTGTADCVVTGMYGIYQNTSQDRRWQYRCCYLGADAEFGDCEQTNWLNEYGKPLHYELPDSGKVIGGISSVHDSDREDRVFKLEICDVIKDQVKLFTDSLNQTYFKII